jgi:putative membrane protein
MRKLLIVFAVVAAVGVAAIVARGGNDVDAPEPAESIVAETTMLAPADVTFLTEAAQAGNAEIELAQLAQRTSVHAGLDAFAEGLERDHKQAGERLEELADRRDVDFPNDVVGLPGPTDEQRDTHTRLAALKGSAFNRAWVEQIVKNHQGSIERYERAAGSADADVRAYAESALPVLRGHLEAGRKLQQEFAAK